MCCPCRSYHTWTVLPAGIGYEEMEAFLRATPRDRTQAEPLVIAVPCAEQDEAWYEGVVEQLLVGHADGYPHVTFT